jgi:hypothetical protein
MRLRQAALARAVALRAAIEAARGGLADLGEIGDRPPLSIADCRKLSTLARRFDGVLETTAAVSAVTGTATATKKCGTAS